MFWKFNFKRKKDIFMPKTYVFSDIHGMGELYDLIKNHLTAGNHKAVFLGDACDRGEDGYAIMKDMLTNENILYIKGNHEDMFVNAARVIMANLIDAGRPMSEWRNETGIRDLIYGAYYNEDVNIHLNNGGFTTLYKWLEDGAPMAFVNAIDKLPTCAEVVSNNGVKYTFCHAGTLNVDKDDIDSRLWSRDHFFEKWNDGILVHGHTPCQHLVRKIGERKHTIIRPVWYANNTKLDMDTGCFSTNTIYLMDIESKEMTKFCAE